MVLDFRDHAGIQNVIEKEASSELGGIHPWSLGFGVHTTRSTRFTRSDPMEGLAFMGA